MIREISWICIGLGMHSSKFSTCTCACGYIVQQQSMRARATPSHVFAAAVTGALINIYIYMSQCKHTSLQRGDKPCDSLRMRNSDSSLLLLSFVLAEPNTSLSCNCCIQSFSSVYILPTCCNICI